MKKLWMLLMVFFFSTFFAYGASQTGLPSGGTNTWQPVVLAGWDGSNIRTLNIDANGNLSAIQAVGPWTMNLTQIGGTAISLGQALMAASLPVTLASNQSALPVTQSGAWTIATNADTGVGAGTAPAKALLQAGIFNTTLPVLTTGQTAAVQLDSSGRLLVGSIAGALPAGTNTIGTVTANAGTGNFNVVGVGTGGTPSGGVLSIQGVAGGTAVPISGTITANNASVGATGAAAPTSATLTGGSFNTTLPTLTTGQMGALQTDSSSRLLIGSIAGALPTGSNVIGAVTQSGTWTTQPGNTQNTTPWLVAAPQNPLNNYTLVLNNFTMIAGATSESVCLNNPAASGKTLYITSIEQDLYTTTANAYYGNLVVETAPSMGTSSACTGNIGNITAGGTASVATCLDYTAAPTSGSSKYFAMSFAFQIPTTENSTVFVPHFQDFSAAPLQVPAGDSMCFRSSGALGLGLNIGWYEK